jgi:hypothetical protein
MGKKSSTFLAIEIPLLVCPVLHQSERIVTTSTSPFAQAIGSQMVHDVSWRDFPSWLEVLAMPRLASNAVVWKSVQRALPLFADLTQGSVPGSRTLSREDRFERSHR